MKPISLSDLTPEGATFTLHSTPGVEYKLRPINLADENWLAETFGKDLDAVFREVRMMPIARICFHQMETESKRMFAQQDVVFINEEGVETTKKIGGAELLFWQMQGGMNEKMEVFLALMKTIGISRDLITQSVDNPELAKAALEVKKKNPSSRPTGRGSLTSSRKRTGGPRSTSGRGRSGK